MSYYGKHSTPFGYSRCTYHINFCCSATYKGVHSLLTRIILVNDPHTDNTFRTRTFSFFSMCQVLLFHIMFKLIVRSRIQWSVLVIDDDVTKQVMNMPKIKFIDCYQQFSKNCSVLVGTIQTIKVEYTSVSPWQHINLMKSIILNPRIYELLREMSNGFAVDNKFAGQLFLVLQTISKAPAK